MLLEADKVTIVDLELIKYSNKVRKDLLVEIERYYSHLKNPLTIEIYK